VLRFFSLCEVLAIWISFLQVRPLERTEWPSASHSRNRAKSWLPSGVLFAIATALILDAPDAREQMRRGLAGTDAAVFLAGDPQGLNVDRVDLGGTVIGTEVAAASGTIETRTRLGMSPAFPRKHKGKHASDHF
jgi:hypothetical protein